MKLTAISFSVFVFLFCISLSSAITFQLNSPQNATQNVSFQVSLSAETSDVYDVKIFIYKDSKSFSEIFNGSSWTNSYNYLLSRFPQIRDYQVVSHFVGDTSICARLRKSESSSFTEVCQPIKITFSNKEENPNPAEEEQENQEDDEENITTPKYYTKEPDFIPETQVAQVSQDSSESDRIVLNSAQKPKETFISKQEKTRLYAVYAFTAFAIVIIILLALRKL